MGRKSTGPRYFESKAGWFAEIKGERVRLTSGAKKATEKEAQTKYERLNAVRMTEVAGDKAEVGAVMNAYLMHAKSRVTPPPLAPNTFKIHKDAIQDFVSFKLEQGSSIGRLQARDLTMAEVQAWIASRKESSRWSDNYAHLRLRVLRTAFLWAAAEGDIISESPFARRGKKVRIGSADLSLKRLSITPEEHAILLHQASRRKRGNFALLLEVLYQTGARPSEVYQARGDEWDKRWQAFVIDPSDKKNIGRLKNRHHLKRKGRKRIITVPDHLVEELSKLAATHGEDFLFRMENGQPWHGGGYTSNVWAKKIATRMRGLVKAVNKLAEKGKGDKVRTGLSLYSYRHAFVTRFLEGQGNPLQLCELLNTSLDMLQAHYSHLLEDRAGLLGAVNRLTTQSVLLR